MTLWNNVCKFPSPSPHPALSLSLPPPSSSTLLKITSYMYLWRRAWFLCASWGVNCSFINLCMHNGTTWIVCDCLSYECIQNITAESDVEKMILGNKCDLAELRVISTERGRMVRNFLLSLLNRDVTSEVPAWSVHPHPNQSIYQYIQ